MSKSIQMAQTMAPEKLVDFILKTADLAETEWGVDPRGVKRMNQLEDILIARVGVGEAERLGINK